MMRRHLAVLAAALAASPAAAQSLGEVVRRGGLTDMSGPDADLAGQASVVAAGHAVEEFGGRPGGTSVGTVSADHRDNADVAANLAREWIDTGGVGGFFDRVNSAAGLAVEGITRDRGIAHIAAGSVTTAPADPKGPWDCDRIVRTIPGDDAFLPLAQSKCPLVAN